MFVGISLFGGIIDKCLKTKVISFLIFKGSRRGKEKEKKTSCFIFDIFLFISLCLLKEITRKERRTINMK